MSELDSNNKSERMRTAKGIVGIEDILIELSTFFKLKKSGWNAFSSRYKIL